MPAHSKKSMLSIPLAIALIALSAGHLALINNKSFGLVLFVSSLVIVGVLYGIRSSFKPNLSKKETLKLIVVLLFVVIETSSKLRFQFTFIFAFASIPIVLSWIIWEITDKVNRKKSDSQSNFILWMGLFFMITYGIIRILNMPFGSVVLLLGLLISAVGFIVDFVLPRTTSS